MKSGFTICTLDKAPAMTTSNFNFTGTYLEAVQAAQDSFRKTGRTTTLCSGHNNSAGYWYHRIVNGVAYDRNINTGIPAEAVLTV